MTVTAEAITFDQAVTTGAGAVKAAQGILDRAKACPWPDNAQAREARVAAVWPLAEALVTYDLMRVGIIHPGDVISGLEAGPAALAVALDGIAAGATKGAAVLADVIGEQRGQKTAEYVSNGAEAKGA